MLIKSKTIRVGNGTIKGYKVDQFNDAFIRYAPTPPIQNVTPSQVNNINKLSHFKSVTQENNVTAKKEDKQER